MRDFEVLEQYIKKFNLQKELECLMPQEQLLYKIQLRDTLKFKSYLLRTRMRELFLALRKQLKNKIERRYQVNRNVFKQGSTVEFAGQKWNVLAEVGKNNFLCVNNDIICHKPFDKNNNNWSVSDLRKYLNGKYLKKFKDVDLVPWKQDLTARDGSKDYGSSTDMIFLLTINQYRQHRQYVREIDGSWWLITATSPTSYSVNNVYMDASINNDCVYRDRNGVRPACVIHLKSEKREE